MPGPEAPGDNDRAARIAALRDWIIAQGLAGADFDSFLETVCLRLVDAGLPLLRFNVSMRMHHPSVGAFAHRWKRETGMIREEYIRDPSVVTGWDQSPLKALIESDQGEMRCRLRPSDRPFAFPMFEDLAAMGATDYFAQRLNFDDHVMTAQVIAATVNMGVLASWTSDAPEGFSDRDLEDLRALLPSLGLALKSGSNYRTAQDLLGVYLGSDAARRVMSGDILRGSLDKIRATMLYFDLRGFTRLSETLAAEALIEMLNDYFGGVVEIVHAHRGNVLKFMGDGLLAVFTERGQGQSRLDAIDAVADIREEFAAINARRTDAGLPVTDFSAALHGGEVLYGNIGGPERLDFTVIGPAVNAAARIQGMCSGLDQQILISSVVAEPALDMRPALVSVGVYRLRGVSDRIELFTLD